MGPGTLAALAAIIVLGVPHGALDGEIARPLTRPHAGRLWFVAFAVPYLTLTAMVLLSWRAAPVATLLGFLAISVWHFGTEDAPGAGWLETAVRGAAPIALPLLAQPVETLHVLSVIAHAPAPAWLVGVAWVWLAACALSVSRRVVSSRASRAATVELAGLAALFIALPPLVAFAIYFVAMHARRHTAALIAAGLAPRVTSWPAAVRHALPVTALTVAIGALLWPYYPGAAPDRLLMLTIQGLAALTVPHMALGALAQAALGRRNTSRAPVTRPLSSRRFSATRVPRSATAICRLIDRPRPECWPNDSVVGRSE